MTLSAWPVLHGPASFSLRGQGPAPSAGRWESACPRRPFLSQRAVLSPSLSGPPSPFLPSRPPVPQASPLYCRLAPGASEGDLPLPPSPSEPWPVPGCCATQSRRQALVLATLPRVSPRDRLAAPAPPPPPPQAQRAPRAMAHLPASTELSNMSHTSSHWDRAQWSPPSLGLYFYLY